MKTIYDNGQFKGLKFKNPVLAIGVFDGVHRGHQHIIRKTISAAKKIGGTSIILTFYPHPEHVLKKIKYPDLLASLNYRLKLIAALKADVCIVINFTKKFSDFSAEEFIINFILKKFKPRYIFVGSDFVFGKNRSGNIEFLKKLGSLYGFKTIKVKPLKINGKIISSTLIRSLIKKGDLQEAGLLLGRSVSVSGTVKRGKGVGRILGFPTANISNLGQAIVPSGVYAVKVVLKNKKFLGMAFNVRVSDRFKNKKIKANLEVHIFNFRKNIYGQEIEVEFYKKMRNVKKFKEIHSLKRQIENDAKEVKKFFHQMPSLINAS